MQKNKRLLTNIFFCGMVLLNTHIILGRTIIVDVDGNGDYLTITEGMGAAVSGDTVYVMEGTYYEHGIRMKENVVLQGAGADKCAIDGGNESLGWPDNTVILFDSIKSGKIDGFTISYKLGAGIALIQSTPIISNNRIINSSDGIYYHGSFPTECSPLINGNTVTGNRLGIYYLLEDMDHQTVDTLDASHNWWGTTVEEEIKAGIQALEGPSICYVSYSPWLTEPIDSLQQSEAGLHWNNIYDHCCPK